MRASTERLFSPGALALALVLCSFYCMTASTASNADSAKERGGAGLPKLFDFVSYKQTFGKNYKSLLEELSRKRYFLSRALRAYVSGVKFRFWQREHYNAVNHMSDLSPAELDLMRNKQLEEESGADDAVALMATQPALGGDKLPELLTDESDDLERALSELIQKHLDEPALGGATGGGWARRRKREIELDTREPRDLPMELLINSGQGDGGALRHKPIKANLISNNPLYEPIEVASFGLMDQQERVKWWRLPARKDARPVTEQLTESLVVAKSSAPKSPAKGPGLTQADEIFVDHRDSGCLLEPRNQGLCGCCYAFAATALLEYHLCKKLGNLTPLSEQYMIDCGRGRFGTSLNGCQGGTVLGTADFVHNFGLETARNYPYAAREGQCPYADDHDLKKTGLYRLELMDAIAIPQENWAQTLPSAPLYVQAMTGSEFEEYGGGIDLGKDCGTKTNHAMVLVGHGRQNGRDYWLLRNSYSTKWGDHGYWKLAKSAGERCLGKFGYAYGTRDGITYKVEPKSASRRRK